MTDGGERETDLSTFRRALLICCGVSLACNLGAYMRIPVVPLFARSLGADTVRVGLINSSFLLMAGLLSLPMGILSDRLGRKPLILGGLLVSAGTSFLLYFSSSTGELILIYLLFGTGLAAFGPTMMSYVADLSPSSHLGRAYGLYTMALYCGMTLGPAIGGYLAHVGGFRQVFLVSGIAIFVMTWPAVFLLPGTGRTHDRGQAKARPAMGELLRNRPLLGCWLATLGSCFGYGMFLTFVPLQASDLGINAGGIGMIFAAQALTNALSRIPFGTLSDRVANRGNLAVAGFTLFIVSLAGLAASTGLTGFLLSAALFGIAMGLIFTSLGALVSLVVPPQARGFAMGGYNTCIYLGMMLSSGLMGVVIGRFGFGSGFLLGALLNAALVPIFYRMIMEFGRGR